MSVDNTLTIEVYRANVFPVYDHSGDMDLAQVIRMGTFYPGGLYGDAELYVPRDVLKWWAIQGANRLAIKNGLVIVWEGEIDQLGSNVDADAEGTTLTCTGHWGSKVMRRRLRRLYVDKRIDQDVWKNMMAPAATGGEADYRVARSDDLGDVLLFEPNVGIAIHSGDLVRLDYYAPTGEGIKKVVFDVDFQEGAGDNFTASLNDATGGAAAFSQTADYTNAGEVWTGAAAGATTQLYAQLSSGATSTPTEGQNYFELSNLKVYAWTSNSGNFADNMDEVAKDLVAEFSTVFNSDVTHIETPGTPFTYTGFICEWETIADILTRAASFGDGATPPNVWEFFLIDSEQATTPNGLPVLCLHQAPVLTATDYSIRLDDENVVAPVTITKDYTRLANWIIVEYYTEGGGVSYKTPDDDATLKDTTSIADYGQRDYVLSVGDTDSTTAIQMGRRYLAKWKDPQYILSGPIQVNNYINGAGGQPVPVCRVRAGQRIRILDYIDDLSGAGLTMMISATDYDADSEVVSITTGALDMLAPWSEQIYDYEAPRPAPAPKPPKKKKRKKKRRKR